MTSNREIRSALVKHLYHYHGEFTMEPGNSITLAALEDVHTILHIDEYACPPHSHEDGIVQKVFLRLGKNYIRKVVEDAKQETKDVG